MLPGPLFRLRPESCCLPSLRQPRRLRLHPGVRCGRWSRFVPETKQADAYSAEGGVDSERRARAAAGVEIKPLRLTPARAARIPRATYRLQLHGGFRLRDALAIIP